MAPEQRRLMDVWRELWSQYKAIIDAFDGLIYISSPSYEIEFVNQHLAERIGYSPLGKKCYQALYQLDHPCPQCPGAKVFRGESVRQKAVDPRSSRTYYQFATLFYQQGEPLMMVTIQYLPANCPLQLISMEPGEVSSGEVSEELAERDVA